MTKPPARPVRCAIYTRVSTDQGLEQDFNSLDAQYEASQAYIRSQAHAGWTLILNRYDDGGFSGGSTERPALQKLLADVRSRRVDIIVVYKVDRLTRSLADFAKLVELFDAHDVSFVSVTQQFNTTTSMGRLTLNVLLSFAQFEREVTSERIRDKIAASKRKGLWVGGMVPLGYDVRDRAVVVNEAEAETVRSIFQRYLDVGALNPLLADLRQRGIVTKQRTHASGQISGGIPFARGSLAYLLRNRFYVGDVVFKGEILPGSQRPILDRAVFEAVQDRLSAQINGYRATRMASDALLAGRLFDDRGNRMSPTHARKAGIRYRYYLSSALIEGQAQQAGSVSRVPAIEIEDAVVRAMRTHLDLTESIGDSIIVNKHVARVDICPDALLISFIAQDEDIVLRQSDRPPLTVPWRKTSSKRRREIMLPVAADASDTRPIRSESRALLLDAIRRGRRWFNELCDNPQASVATIALQEGCSIRKINMTISLAFLAPSLVRAAIEGRLPRGTGFTRLIDLPPEWSRQHQALDLQG